MSEKSKRVLLIFSICLNIGFLIFAGYGYYRHQLEPGPHARSKKFSASIIFDTVDLSPRQKEEVERLVELFHANMLAFGKQASPVKIEIMKRLAGPLPIGTQELQSYTRRINQLEIGKEKVVIEHFLALRKMLTDEQAARVFARFAEIQKKWANRIRFSEEKKNQ